jgi:uncharacterized protein
MVRLVPVFLMFLCWSISAQTKTGKEHFIIKLIPARATFVDDMTDAEGAKMGEHFAYLKKLTSEKKVLLAGPSINGPKTFGLIVVEVANEAEARDIAQGDPSVKAGIQRFELLPFRLALMYGR